MKICPKCQGEMKKSQKVNRSGTGLEKPVFKCRCGWCQVEGEKTGYWVKQ